MIANLIAIIVGIVFIAFFAGFNLDNKCDVSLVFYTFKQIPVFFTILISFAVGLLCALPFALVRRSKKAKQIKNNEQINAKNLKEKKNKKNHFEKKSEVKNQVASNENANAEQTFQSEQNSDSSVSKNIQNSETENGKTE